MRKRDTIATAFLLLCAVLFVGGTAAKLNGSSVAVWNRVLLENHLSDGVLLSQAREARSDEWEVWTPAAVAQSRLDPPFPAENPSLGYGKTPLIYNLPVRHYTLLFRPQFWGFFGLGVERGYAWYWNAKLFGLLASLFVLFRCLTRNSIVSALGSVLVTFSGYVQWWFSCPPLLPELLANWALATTCAIALFKAARWPTRVAASLGFLYFLVAFTLSLYPPYQIPLLYLGVLLAVGTLTENRLATGHGRAAGLCLVVTAVAAVALLAPMFMECLPTLERVSNTLYPGARRTYGGGVGVHELLSGVMGFFLTEGHFPDGYPGVNAAANVYPLWLAAVVMWIDQVRRRVRRVGLICPLLLIALSVQGLYAMFPWPPWLCRLSLLDLATPVRMLLGIGVTGTVFTVLVLAPSDTGPSVAARPVSRWTVLVSVAAAGAYVFLLRAEHPQFLGPMNLLFLAALNMAIVAAFFLLPVRVFALAFGGIMVVATGLTNPIMRGLGPLLDTPAVRAIEQLRRTDPAAAWLVYEDNALSELVMSTGARVESGVKIVPDLEFYAPADPAGTFRKAYNRYSFGYFAMPEHPETLHIVASGFPSHIVVMHPSHPALRRRNVRFFVFRGAVPGPERFGLDPVAQLPANRVWIYRYSGLD